MQVKAAGLSATVLKGLVSFVAMDTAAGMAMLIEPMAVVAPWEYKAERIMCASPHQFLNVSPSLN
jgi:hypothetical protein